MEFDVRIVEQFVRCQFLVPNTFIPCENCLGIKWMEIMVVDYCDKADLYLPGQNRIPVLMDVSVVSV